MPREKPLPSAETLASGVNEMAKVKAVTEGPKITRNWALVIL